MSGAIYAVRGRVACITLDEPASRNAMTKSVQTELLAALRRADEDPEIAVVLLSANGDVFSAGGDLRLMQTFRDRPATEIYGEARRSADLFTYLLGMTTPIIAAVNGPAVGAGFDLTQMCDIRIASTEAQFGETFVNLGIIPGDGGSWFLTRAVGYQRAAELTFSGRLIKADEALALGLVLEVVKPDELLARAQDMARRMSYKPPQALRYSKRLLKLSQRMPLPEYLDICSSYQALCHKTEDHAEALQAFFEKRRGEFKGR